MNFVAASFYENVTELLYTRSLRNASALSGVLGKTARKALDIALVRHITICNGQLANLTYRSRHKTSADGHGRIVYPGPKDGHFYFCEIWAGHERYNADPAIMTPAALPKKGSNVTINLITTNLSPEMEKFIDAVPSVSSIQIEANITASMETAVRMTKILKKLVEKKTLNYLAVCKNGIVDFTIFPLLLNLLKQDQFYNAEFGTISLDFLKAIVIHWHHNSKLLAGKRIRFRSALDETKTGQIGFKGCPREDWIAFRRYHPRITFSDPAHLSHIVGASIIKKQNGNALYLLRIKNDYVLTFS